VAVPTTVAPVLAVIVITVELFEVTVFPEASLMAITGCVENAAPLAAPAADVVSASAAAAPAEGVIDCVAAASPLAEKVSV